MLSEVGLDKKERDLHRFIH